MIISCSCEQLNGPSKYENAIVFIKKNFGCKSTKIDLWRSIFIEEVTKRKLATYWNILKFNVLLHSVFLYENNNFFRCNRLQYGKFYTSYSNWVRIYISWRIFSVNVKWNSDQINQINRKCWSSFERNKLCSCHYKLYHEKKGKKLLNLEGPGALIDYLFGYIELN